MSKISVCDFGSFDAFLVWLLCFYTWKKQENYLFCNGMSENYQMGFYRQWLVWLKYESTSYAGCFVNNNSRIWIIELCMYEAIW